MSTPEDQCVAVNTRQLSPINRCDPDYTSAQPLAGEGCAGHPEDITLQRLDRNTETAVITTGRTGPCVLGALSEPQGRRPDSEPSLGVTDARPTDGLRGRRKRLGWWL